MKFIRAIDSFLREYSPRRLLRDFLRNSPAYTGADYLTPKEEVKPKQGKYSDDIYENRQPDFTEEDQLYRGDYVDIPQSDSHIDALHRSFPTSEDISDNIPTEQEPMSDADLIEMAIDEVKSGVIPIDFDGETFGEPFDESSADTDTVYDDSYDEPFDQSAWYGIYDTPDGTLDELVDDIYDGMYGTQDDIYDDPNADPSLEDMVDEPMEDPQDMPEPEPMDPMDDPLDPYMPYGGFPFPPGG